MSSKILIKILNIASNVVKPNFSHLTSYSRSENPVIILWFFFIVTGSNFHSRCDDFRQCEYTLMRSSHQLAAATIHGVSSVWMNGDLRDVEPALNCSPYYTVTEFTGDNVEESQWSRPAGQHVCSVTADQSITQRLGWRCHNNSTRTVRRHTEVCWAQIRPPYVNHACWLTDESASPVIAHRTCPTYRVSIKHKRHSVTTLDWRTGASHWCFIN